MQRPTSMQRAARDLPRILTAETGVAGAGSPIRAFLGFWRGDLVTQVDGLRRVGRHGLAARPGELGQA